MTEPFLIVIPVMVLITVALLAFTGCQEFFPARPWETVEPPSVVTGPATDIESTQATLTGTVNPHGQPAAYHFEYSKTPFPADTDTAPSDAIPAPVPDASAGSGTDDQDLDEEITNLDFDSDYHFRIVAYNVADPTIRGAGSDQLFHTLPSTAYHDVIVTTPDLLSYWRLEETSGTMATDSGPAGNHGAYVGGVTLGQPGALTGAENFAVQFDGVSGEMTANGPMLSGACSIEGWFNWTGGRGILSDDATSGGWRFAYEAGGTLAFRIAGTLFNTMVPLAYVQDGWHHFVATKDEFATVALYLDGQPIPGAGGASDNTAPQMPWHLMRDRPSSGQPDEYAAGWADEVAMYGAALDLSTVQDHFEKATSG